MLTPREEVLFGLNGIQDLDFKPNIIGIHGKIGHGKDTFCRRLAKHRYLHHMSFANPLKDALKSILGCDKRFYFGTQEEKAHPLPLFWRERLQHAWEKCHPDQDVNPIQWNSFRESMQLFGDEVGRQCIADLLWVWSIEFRIMEAAVHGTIRPGDLVVFADVRYDNEALNTLRWGGDVFGVINGNKLGEEGEFSNHNSESGISFDLITKTFTCYSTDEVHESADWVLETFYRG